MNTRKHIPKLAAAMAIGLGFATSAPAQITPGADFEVDASTDTDADSVWEDLIGTSGYEFLLDTGNGVARVAVSGSTQFTHAYDFPGNFAGSGEGGVGGTKLVLVGETGECRSFRDAGYDNLDATLEFWIRPDTLSHTQTNGQVIWEDGGGTGYGLFIKDSVIYSDNDNGSDAQISYDLTADSLGLLLGLPTAEFIQVVLTRVASNGAEEMFINGVSVGTATDSGGNWSGGDGAGLGARGEANVGGQGGGDDGTQSFDGKIALFRIYSGPILTPAEILANFQENSGPDLVAPAIASTDPADDATGVYPGTTALVATFSEDIALTGSGTVTITDVTDGTDTVAITLPDAGVTVSGNELTIDLGASLEFATDYEISIDGSALQDTADTPNAYGGTASGEWTFTTVAQDLTAPIINSTDPADEATNIAPGVNLVATFDENLIIGTGTITIVDVTDGTGTQVITLPDPAVSIAGTVLTIDPPADMEGNSLYAVQLGAGVVRNFSEVGNDAIADTITWNFTTTDTTVYSGATGSFNKDTWNDPNNWTAGVPSGALNAIIDTGEYASVSVAYSLVPCPAYTGDLTLNQNATLEIASGSDNTDLNALGGGTITMNTGSEIAFRRSADTTHANDIVVAGDAEIDLCRSTNAHVRDRTFNGEISGSGRLSIFGESRNNGYFNGNNASWSGGLRAYNGNSMVFGGAANSLGTGDVTIDDGMSLGITAADAMGDSATLTLDGNPGSDNGSARNKLEMNADDTVGMLVRNGFPYPAGTYGASGSGATYEVSWISGTGILTVAGAPVDGDAPTLLASAPADDRIDVFVAEWFVLDFNEPMLAGTGNILVKNLSDGVTTTVSAADPSVVSITDTRVVIDLSGNLQAGKSYAIQIESTAFTDLFGNAYAGITDDVSWNFVTIGTKTFGEDFESPDVTAAQSDGNTSGAIPTGWVGATQGFGGTRRGIVDEAHGDFTDPVGEQAFAFRYTNSGLTTAEGVLCPLLAGATYTVSFDVVLDGHNATTPYNAQLIAFADGARRDDCRSTPSGSTVLASKTGNATGDGVYSNVSFSFTASAANAADLGKDVGLRFKGATSSAIIDNVVVTIEGETIAPEFVSYADDVSGGPVNVPNPIVYTVTFNEAMDASSIGTDDFENGITTGAAGIIISNVNATADPAVYEVTVTTTAPGDLLLQIKAGAVITDANGNALDTTSAIPDTLTIVVEGAAANPYAGWAAGFGGLSNTDAAVDFDKGGLPTGLEYVVGGDPTDPTDDAGLAPTIDNTDAEFVVFTFNRTDLANDDVNTTITVEYGNDLNGWTTAVDDGTDILISATDNGATDEVQVSLRRSVLQLDGRLFIRLKAVVATP